MQIRQESAEILNGRPWIRSGPPVGLYHPVFNRFFAYFEETTPRYRTASSVDPDESMPSMDDAFSFMKASSHFYVVEQSGRVDESPPSGRVEAVLPIFSRLLGTSLPRVKNSDLTEPDARAIVRTLTGHNALSALVELKLEPGIGGDAKTQHEPIRSSSCSPCFLVEIAGPWITVLGAVYLQKVLIQRLAGPIYLPPQGLHPIGTIDTPLRLFSALRRALRDLTHYYESLPCQPTNSRFFPFVRSYILNGDRMDIEYVSPLSEDDSKAAYLAKQADGKEVVVKFVLTYNTRAHCLLAGDGLAPGLIYDGTKGPRYGGLLMVVMDYVKGGTLTELLRSSPPKSRLDPIIKSVEKAIELLHANDLVFGDLRTPNILVDGNGAKLVDYDWCGVHQVDRYPFIIGDAIEWAEGVGPRATLHKDHDLHMLERLKVNIRAGDCPGNW
ncbi:hypothetical protein F5887DRAFT_994791 [Amanita rubescens]|nr:hypothetical protein F5887DRAFT_997729 [Amanita rubescens]KAF8333267.1 hypothetical protein F5887DRAFT_994791 [Amanita rubescens]